ncbi:uncharacterized protein V6R79_026341 [Siganus canaliculatus]
MLISTLQPLEVAEDANFRDFVKKLNPEFEIPPTPKVHSLLLSVYDEKKQEVRAALDQATDIVLTCELWSSRAENSLLTVGCHFVDNLGSLKSYVLKTTNLYGDKSQDNIKTQLLIILNDWNVQEKVHWEIRSGMEHLKNVKTKWTHMPCFADTLNVLFKHLMKDAEVSDVLRKCQDIIRFFSNDSKAVKKLREIQQGLKMKQDELILYSGNRWLPWLRMLQQLMDQYGAMVMVLNDSGKTNLILNEKEKEKNRQIISALNILRNVACTMQGKGYQTISTLLPLLNKLVDGLKGEKQQNEVASALLSKCKEEFGDIQNHFLATITFLDPRFKNQLGEQNIKKATKEITAELTKGQSSFSAAVVKQKLDTYFSYEPTDKNSNPLAWWRYKGKEKFSELAELAVKKLGIISTAVPLERAFSIEGDQFCDLRTTIKPEHLDMILFLKSNW